MLGSRVQSPPCGLRRKALIVWFSCIQEATEPGSFLQGLPFPVPSPPPSSLLAGGRTGRMQWEKAGSCFPPLFLAGITW